MYGVWSGPFEVRPRHLVMDPTVWSRRPVDDEIEYLRKVGTSAAASHVRPGTEPGK